MIEESTSRHILNIFFENPTQQFHLRELARTAKLSLPTILSVTDQLAKEKYIVKKKGKVVTIVQAQREDPYFARHKRVYNLQRLYDSGIIDALTTTFHHPKAIVVFGSFSRGEDTERSDIDIAVLTTKQASFPIEKYERFLRRKINIHEVDVAKVSKEFAANLHNGILLEGSW